MRNRVTKIDWSCENILFFTADDNDDSVSHDEDEDAEMDLGGERNPVTETD